MGVFRCSPVQVIQGLQPKGSAVLILGSKGLNQTGYDRKLRYASGETGDFINALFNNFDVTHFSPYTAICMANRVQSFR